MVNKSSLADVEALKKKLQNLFTPYGFEYHAFKLGWYNDVVKDVFKLPYDYDTIAFVFLSVPQMFEKSFLPFLKEDKEYFLNHQDPLDQCLRKQFGRIYAHFPEEPIEILHDFDLTATRRPKIIMQTVGHISGAVCYYQRKDLGDSDPWKEDRKIYGVCIHPIYGGWFAFRTVVIFKNVICGQLVKREPEDCIKDKDKLKDLLELFNMHWKDSRYRDVIPAKEKYSDLQVEYFTTKPRDRRKLIIEKLYSKENV